MKLCPKALLAGATALALTLPALSQTYRDASGTIVSGVVPIEPGVGPLFTNSNPGVISGSFSATLSGFQPTPSYSYQSVTTSSAAYTLPSGTVDIFYNTGSNPITVKLGNSSVSVASGQADVIQPSSWMAFTAGAATYYAVIGNGGSSTVVVSGGSGLPTGAGGGGGGGGGSSAITTWAGGTLGAMANYGTSPGTVPVPGVNAYVTNQPTVTTTPKTASFTIAGCTVGTSSAQCLAGSTAVNHIMVQNASATANIACSWGGTAAINASNSFQLTPGQSSAWGPFTSGVPSAALNCIAGSASTPLYLEYN